MATTADEVAKQQIKREYTSFIDAHNARQWNRDAEPWCSLPPELKFELAYGDTAVVDINGYLERGRKAGADPTWKVEILDIEVDVRSKPGVGVCYVNLAARSEDLVRHSVVVARYELREERWKCVSYRHVRGMNVHGS